ncbi:2-acylglycerol O-acyltransferase 2-B-like [Phacochoerus africanus]|uniref:2-acylglycerol O-acyltransferase 2-B-like n=1 Tax=Phacochoerus africanus TaxID=41426 RepID=UPI001FDA921A|nr:2-acylglycerol O-acyltransferase 2-B-like [Phacochoerus africanus]
MVARETALYRMPASSSCLRQSLQVFAVLQWVFSFLGLAQVCLAALILVLLGRAWILAVLYLVWLYRDRNTPWEGGRRSAWVRNWAIWSHFRDYFPISLVKTTELDPSRNYVFGIHPHGVMVIGAFSNFCTDATGFSHLFPGLRPHLLMLPCWFNLPIFRDYIMCAGLVSSDKASASYLLSRPQGGQVAVLSVGGPLEALEAKPGALTLRIRNQKGFVKLALEHGASLVPVFSFGENELFQQFPNPPGSWVRRAQEGLQPLLRVALPLFRGPWGLPLPFRSPIHTVVGAPIPVQRIQRPSREQVDALHAIYVERLTQLFEEHKARYGVPANRHLLLI